MLSMSMSNVNLYGAISLRRALMRKSHW